MCDITAYTGDMRIPVHNPHFEEKKAQVSILSKEKINDLKKID